MSLLKVLTLAIFLSDGESVNPSAQIGAIIDPQMIRLAKKYNCSISLAMLGSEGAERVNVTSVGGVVDVKSKQPTESSDKFVWGSVTKVVTGMSVLRLVDQKKIKLTDSVPQYIDPMLRKMSKQDPEMSLLNITAMEDIWGAEVYNITVKDLLGMRSGVPDYDTASPTGRGAGDKLRKDAYAHPNDPLTPPQILNFSWVRTGKLLFTPGICDTEKYFNCYSSTNFVLLGFLLAYHADAKDWIMFNQADALASVARDLPGLRFAVTGAPSEYTRVKGYDRTHYNNNTKAIDVSDVAGVFGGWTASDLVLDASGVAALGQDLYGPSYKLLAKDLVDEMYAESADTGYGLATFNLTWVAQSEIAYGHLGATYGYQSLVIYIPSVNLSMAIATNIERDSQDQPRDVFCNTFHAAKAIMLGMPVPECEFVNTGYYGSFCNCSTNKDVVLVV